MDQVEAVIELLREFPRYSQSKRINLCEVCTHGRLIPRYILCKCYNSLSSDLCAACDNFELNTDVFQYDHKFRCRLCVHSTYLEKDEFCKGLFCTYNDSEDSIPYWISESKAHSCQNFKFYGEKWKDEETWNSYPLIWKAISYIPSI